MDLCYVKQTEKRKEKTMRATGGRLVELMLSPGYSLALGGR